MKQILSVYLVIAALILLVPLCFAGIPEGEKNEGESALITIPVYRSAEGKTAEMDLEEYIKGVLPAEMPASFSPEALKAQAVAARTYAVYKHRKFTNDPTLAPTEHPDASVCDNPSHCSAYLSGEEMAQRWGDEWMREYLPKTEAAVEETRGEIIVYGDEPILAAFHAASGGDRTENAADVWGGDLPYLQSVPTEGEELRREYETVVEVTADEVREKLGTEPVFGEVTHTEGGSVKEITVGDKSFTGGELRSAFGLRSAVFSVETEDELVRFRVKGAGHGVGLSQYGANYYAVQGEDYVTILSRYYPGTHLEAIED